jgi:hypothetical protein
MKTWAARRLAGSAVVSVATVFWGAGCLLPRGHLTRRAAQQKPAPLPRRLPTGRAREGVNVTAPDAFLIVDSGTSGGRIEGGERFPLFGRTDPTSVFSAPGPARNTT